MTPITRYRDGGVRHHGLQCSVRSTSYDFRERLGHLDMEEPGRSIRAEASTRPGFARGNSACADQGAACLFEPLAPKPPALRLVRGELEGIANGEAEANGADEERRAQQ
jgi:hypothetical protein